MSVFSLVFAGLHLVAVFFLLFIAAPYLVALALWPLSLIFSWFSILWVTPMATIDISTPGPQAVQAIIPTVPTVRNLSKISLFTLNFVKNNQKFLGKMVKCLQENTISILHNQQKLQNLVKTGSLHPRTKMHSLPR